MSQNSSSKSQNENSREKRKRGKEIKSNTLQEQIDEIKKMVIQLAQDQETLKSSQASILSLLDDVKKGEEKKQKMANQSDDVKLRRYSDIEESDEEFAPFGSSDEEEKDPQILEEYLYREPIETTHQRLIIPEENRMTLDPEILNFWTIDWERKAMSTWLDECYYDEGLEIWLKLQWEIQEIKKLKTQWILDMAHHYYPQTARENFEFFVNRMIFEEQSPRMIRIIWEEWKKIFDNFRWFTFEEKVNQLIRRAKGGY